MDKIEITLKAVAYIITTILLPIITYFAGRYFRNKDKKSDSKHNLFQELKIKSINLFIDNYSETELIWQMLPTAYQFKGSEVDVLLSPKYHKLISSYNKLFILIDDNEIKNFTKLLDNSQKIRQSIHKVVQFSHEPNIYQLTIQVEDLIVETKKQNTEILKSIGVTFRKYYNNQN